MINEFRNTSIRTYAGNLVYLPNSLAPTSVVENISRRPSFRILFNLGISYDTPVTKINDAQELIRQAIKEEPGITDVVHIHFLGFGDVSMDFQVIYYIYISLFDMFNK